MSSRKIIILIYSFNFACYLAALGMTIFWCYKFWLDEDLCLVDYKPFKNSENVEHPMLSLCFLNPIDQAKLKRYNKSFTETKYLNFLKGIDYHKGMELIKHEDVILNINNFYLGNMVLFNNGTEVRVKNEGSIQELPNVTFSGIWDGNLLKCHGLEKKDKDIDYMYFAFNSSIFSNRIRPEYGEKLQPITFLHFSNKILLARNTYKETWPQRIDTKEYSMDFILNQVEVLKRRQKRNSHCLHDSLNYDETIIMNHLNNVGCRPPYQMKRKNLTICSTSKKRKQSIINLQMEKFENLLPACTSIENINFRYEESHVDWSCKDCFWIGVIFPYKYKEITQVKAVDIQTLIGNASAYLGLILGFTILQLPSFLGHLRERAQRLMLFVNQEDQEKEGQDKNISRC